MNKGIKIEAFLYAKHVPKNVKEWTKIAKKEKKKTIFLRLKENAKKLKKKKLEFGMQI